MHEVSFMDKEKEHMSRMQDAEEMKVMNMIAEQRYKKSTYKWLTYSLLCMINYDKRKYFIFDSSRYKDTLKKAKSAA